MRKLLVTLALAGTLSVPSVVFAEANWYGSLRSGLKFSDGDTKVVDIASRWGIKGSAEAGEGLTAVYRFEHKISTENAGQPGGRLAYVGLSGGFGSVTMGQIWSASYNSVGAITDNSYQTGDSHTSGRHGNVISYAFSNDLMALQIDAVYDGGMAEGGTSNDPDLEKAEFGLSVNIGEIGKVAIAHTDDKYALDKTTSTGADTKTTLGEGDTTWRTKTNTIAGEVSVAGFRFYAGSQKEKKMCTGAVDGSGDIIACSPTDRPQDADTEQKRTFFGSSGSLGDTGISYLFQWRDIKDKNKPWMLGVYKSLGGGASLNLEHSNKDDMGEDESYVFLAVNF